MHIFTAGYEGSSLDAVLRRLIDTEIAVLADVRERPLSRKRGFSKTTLSAALSAAGIEYRHIRELGCPKPVRDRYRADGDWDAYTRSFMRHLEQQSVAIDALSKLAATKRTALLCLEADFTRCHRTYVARAVVKATRGCVVHITKDALITAAEDICAQ